MSSSEFVDTSYTKLSIKNQSFYAFLVRFNLTIKIDLPAGWLEMAHVFSSFYQSTWAKHSLGLE